MPAVTPPYFAAMPLVPPAATFDAAWSASDSNESPALPTPDDGPAPALCCTTCASSCATRCGVGAADIAMLLPIVYASAPIAFDDAAASVPPWKLTFWNEVPKPCSIWARYGTSLPPLDTPRSAIGWTTAGSLGAVDPALRWTKSGCLPGVASLPFTDVSASVTPFGLSSSRMSTLIRVTPFSAPQPRACHETGGAAGG